MEIQVTGISQPETKQKGKNTWQEITVDYIGKKGPQKQTLRSFAGQVFNDFLRINPPSTVDVKTVKEGDFWQWKGATVIENGTQNKSAVAQSTTATKGNWETAEERADRQRYIVRQSSITNAINLLAPAGPAALVEVLRVAKQFEDYVFSGEVPEAPAKSKKAKSEVTDDLIQ